MELIHLSYHFKEKLQMYNRKGNFYQCISNYDWSKRASKWIEYTNRLIEERKEKKANAEFSK